VVSGDGATFADSPFNRPMTILGEGSGDDLRGGSAADNIGFVVEPGNDSLAGGAGDDLIAAESGDDEVDGGPGTDTASYVNAATAVTVDLAIGAQQDTGGGGLDTLTAVEHLTGSQLGDTLRGDAGPNRLAGSGGGDTIEGRTGVDEVLGDDSAAELGDDVLLVRDGIADTVTCFGGTDTVTADRAGVDSIAADCETVSLAPTPVTPEAPKTKPKCKKRKKKKGSKGAASAKKKKKKKSCKKKRRKK
jgi:Ca2+-binding RTX toxin-like protein